MDSMVKVPSDLYQHFASYIIEDGDSYDSIANSIYQGLTSCQAMSNQNNYEPSSIKLGAELIVPVRCACPTVNQTARGGDVDVLGKLHGKKW
ncbi:Protein LYK5 [Morella rubra]|uniref:Protein LYK5 n=1 Tax=Morella rubra TaxID=262757 RepID=A0A6A1V312_9ROSI|nr:Protein LYK5 [Morella rubra]